MNESLFFFFLMNSNETVMLGWLEKNGDFQSIPLCSLFLNVFPNYVDKGGKLLNLDLFHTPLV